MKTRYTPDGVFEIPDPTPAAVPIDFRPPPSMQEMLRMYVRSELSRVAQDQGAESFEEADDFDIEGEEAISSPWELRSDQEAAQEEEWERQARLAGWNPAAQRSTWEEEARARGWEPPQGQSSQPAQPAQPPDGPGASSPAGSPAGQ